MNLGDRNLAPLLRLNAFARKRREIMRLMAKGFSGEEIEQRILTGNLFKGLKRFKDIYETFDVEREIKVCRDQNIAILTFLDEEYPQSLKQISDPPLLLYSKGTLDRHDFFSIAIVGSRRPNLYGQLQTRRFAFKFAEQGLSVISGMARGIDQFAHEAALKVPYGRTLAVLGCGLDVDYPKRSQSLKDKIVERGALLSEYPLGTPPFAENFPKRNRIIAGLTMGTLVVQAHDRSGSLITARQAAEEGREVFALPGSVEDLVSTGTHRLIREGAGLVTSPEEVMEVIAPLIQHQKEGLNSEAQSTPEKESVPLPLFEFDSTARSDSNIESIVFSKSQQVVVKLLKSGPLSHGEIVERSKENRAGLSGILLDLEIQGIVERKPDGLFELL